MTIDNELNHEERKLAEYASEKLIASADQLDAATLSRLNQARQRALEELPGRHRYLPLRWLVPTTSLAGAALVAMLLLQPSAPIGVDPTAIGSMAINAEILNDESVDFELLMVEDDLEMIEELEFFVWLTTEVLEASG
jgi:hypothetical protein